MGIQRLLQLGQQQQQQLQFQLQQGTAPAVPLVGHPAAPQVGHPAAPLVAPPVAPLVAPPVAAMPYNTVPAPVVGATQDGGQQQEQQHVPDDIQIDFDQPETQADITRLLGQVQEEQEAPQEQEAEQEQAQPRDGFEQYFDYDRYRAA